MPIQFQCPNCSARLQVADGMAGKQAKCKCGNIVPIPQASNAPSAPTASAAPKPPTAAKSTNPSGTPAASPAAGSVGKISVQCKNCQRNLQAPAAAAGKGIKCPCGAVVAVPGNASPNKSSSSGPAPAATKPPVAAPAKPAQAAKSPPPVIAPMGSLLDELTEKDWSTKPVPVPTADKPKTSDGDFLRHYASKSPEVKAAGKSASSGDTGSGPIPNYMVQSILVTLFCCWPVGISAIFASAKVNSLLAAGDRAGALANSKKAKGLCWFSFLGSLIANLCVMIYYVVVIFFALNEIDDFDLTP